VDYYYYYFKQLTPESVQRDVDSLVQTLEVISKPREEGGTDGGWAPPPYNLNPFPCPSAFVLTAEPLPAPACCSFFSFLLAS
jgi:hypothetical protein